MAANEISFVHEASFQNGHNQNAVSVNITKISGGPNNFLAYAYYARLIEDNDGAPRCYGRNRPGSQLQQNLQPLDNLGNATRPWRHFVDNDPQTTFRWVGLYAATPAFARQHNLVIDDRANLEDENGRYPVVQQAGAPAPGYYVSMTARAANPSLRNWDQRRYWDASAIEFAVYATHDWRGKGVSLGDYGLVIQNNSGNHSGFFFADTRRHGVGECSRKVIRTLSPRGARGSASFLIFPGSGGGVERAQRQASITEKLKAEMQKLQGVWNADDLVSFLSLDANLGQFNRYRDNERIKQRAARRARDDFPLITRALKNYGFAQQIGDFPVGSQSSA